MKNTETQAEQTVPLDSLVLCLLDRITTTESKRIAALKRGDSKSAFGFDCRVAGLKEAMAVAKRMAENG